MAGLDDYLTSVANSDWGQAASSIPDQPSFSFSDAPRLQGAMTAAPTGADPNNTVDALEVTAPEPPPPPIKYNNTDDIQALQAAQKDAPRVDGGTGRGIWGLLPHQISHGTVRDILGAIGDGFLITNGHQPMYQNRVDARTVGQAMAGYANNPQAAIERVAATGAPGSIDLADKLQQNYGNLELRKQIQEQNNDYHRSMIGARNQSVYDTQARNILSGMIAPIQGIKDPVAQKQAYTQMYSQADTLAKKIDPSATANTAYGLPVPDEKWTPSMIAGWGTSGNAQLHAETSRESIGERGQGSLWAHQDRQAALHARPQQPTTAGMIARIAPKIDNGTATAAEKQIWNRYINGTKHGGGLHNPNAAGGSPTQTDINYLKAHPEMRAQFESHFGRGTASQYLR